MNEPEACYYVLRNKYPSIWHFMIFNGFSWNSLATELPYIYFYYHMISLHTDTHGFGMFYDHYVIQFIPI